MKEQRIIIEIGNDGRITADADGFSGDTCLRELERLLDELGPGTASTARKPGAGTTQLNISKVQNVEKKP